MANKQIFKAPVIRQEEIDHGVFSMWLKSDAARLASPGQFVNFYLKDGAHMLGRPISICDMNKTARYLQFVYQKKGFGTSELSTLSSGDEVRFLGPLGNGFPVDSLKEKKALLIGGGMGVAPLLGLARTLGEDATAILGYRQLPFLMEAFEETGCRVLVSSEAGLYGTKGNVLDVLKAENISGEVACVCGPKPMIRAVSQYLKEEGTKTYVSLEEKMACGIGACLGCVTPATEANDHYQVKKLCVCKDGPVFNASEVVL